MKMVFIFIDISFRLSHYSESTQAKTIFSWQKLNNLGR